MIVEVLTSSLAGRRFAFASKDLRSGVMIGRAPDCKIRFDGARDLKVSGHHALLEERNEGIFLRDQGSSNGLYVNKHRATVEGTRLYDGYEISLGQEGALLKLVIPGEPPPPESKFPSSLKPPAKATASDDDDPESLTLMVNEVGAQVGAGDKTKHMIKAVAERLEARAAQRRANLVTLIGALFMLIAAAGAIGVWYYQHNESKQAIEGAESSAKLDENERKRDEAEKARADAEKERQKELDELRTKMRELEGALADQVETLKAEQETRFERLKKEVDEATAARVKEISEAQLKELQQATDAQINRLKELYQPPSESVFRELADSYNESVFLVFVRYVLLDEDGKAVGVESGTGTGWLAKNADGKAWVVTNKHVVKPYLFKADLAISHAIRGVHPAPVEDWVIAAWQPGTNLRSGSGALDLAEAWASTSKFPGGRGRCDIAGFAEDNTITVGEDYAPLLEELGFRTDLPAEILERVKKVSIHRPDHNDLAVLELQRPDKAYLAHPLPIADLDALRLLGQMDPVMTLGFPLGLKVIRDSKVTSSPAGGQVRNVQLESGSIFTSAPNLPGNSGGPLINADGKVIGVVTRKQGEGDTLVEAIASDHVRALIDKVAK